MSGDETESKWAVRDEYEITSEGRGWVNMQAASIKQSQIVSVLQLHYLHNG